MVLVLELLGASLLVLAYAGLSRWSAESWPYVALNLVGAALLAAVAVVCGRAGFAALWVVWFLAAGRAALGLLLVERES